MLEMREIVALFTLAISAYTDLKERNIYVIPVFSTVVISMLMSIAAIITASEGSIVEELGKWIIIPWIVGSMIIASGLLLEKVIGMGDIYLIVALIVTLGVRFGLHTLIVALILGGLFCGYLLISGKASRHDGIPFAPFLLAAFMGKMLFG